MLPLVIAICERKEGLEGDGKKRKRDGEERRETGEEENPFKECAFLYDTFVVQKSTRSTAMASAIFLSFYS